MTRVLRATMAIAVGVLPLQWGCIDSDPGRHIVVLIDRSCSVSETIVEGYRADWERLVVSVRPGDRVTMGPITSETYAMFRPMLDAQIPRFHWLVDNKLRFDARARAARRQMLQAFEAVRQVPCSSKTPLLDSINVAEKLFADGDGARLLVILSDMFEDSEAMRFDRLAITPEVTRRIITARQRAGIMPQLKEVEVFISGAATNVSAREIQRLQSFWTTYFSAAGARLPVNHYGPTLLAFGPAPAKPPASRRITDE